MIEDVYEPLARYRDEFKEKFARLTREKFKDLTEKSQVDVPANRKLVARIKELQKEAGRQRVWKTFLGFLIALGFIAMTVAGVGSFLLKDSDPEAFRMWLAAALAGFALAVAIVPVFNKVSRSLAELESQIKAKTDLAWEQMAPLNRLYTWDITVRLIEATVPRLAFDPYFTDERLFSLRERYGWDDSFNDGKSVIFAQSGVINGNPFVFGQYLDMEWGRERYEGTKEIHWTEWEDDEDGRPRRVERHETLHAYVTKPLPVHFERKLLIYGNDAAPNLSFSREPSGLSPDSAAIFSNLKKKWRLSRLKAYSRNLTDDSDFTLMSNHEFETWFHAKDRDNEVEFRLLFTPVAQTQMLGLMKDREVGYGDDFSFLKRRKVNILLSRHLDEATIDTDPATFRNWDYDAAFTTFVQFNERYFKDAYFSLAPLLAIPLYQQTRTHEDIWDGVLGRRASSFWEHETLANYYGERRFKHPACITRSILKTSVTRRGDGERTVSVTAHGYRGEDRVEYVSVHGGDGKWHDVPVHWTEYLPVQRTSDMHITEERTPSEKFRQRLASANASAYRRAIISFLTSNAQCD